jgi:hypothetical protein
MGGACGTNWKKRDAYTIFVRKSERNRHMSGNNIKIDLREKR